MTGHLECTASPTGLHERVDMAGERTCKHCGAWAMRGPIPTWNAVHRAEPRASLGLNLVTAMVLRAAALPRKGGNTMSQQWPDPNDPNTPHPQPIQQPPGEGDAPGAPHTPESPRETPRPDDGDNGDAEA